MESMKKRFVWPLLAALAIGGGSYFGGNALMHSPAAMAQAQAQTAKPTPTPQTDTVAPASDLSKAFRAVHDSLKDAVVNIHVVKKPLAMGGNGRVQQRVQIPEQFRDMLPPGFEDQLGDQLRQRAVEGTGSGVIVSADGYILTNNHVVDSADEVKVKLNDGRELTAEVVGTDPKTDLAVVRVKADHLTFAKFGDSEALDVGDWVLAFGSPFGLTQTMTQGIISAKGRSQMNIIASHDPSLAKLTYENYLQTDAAINPGNSGGPLVNLKGEVVGINAAIASSTGAYNGVGFSIPSNDARWVMKSLIEHGKVVRGYLGISIEDIANAAPDDKDLIDSIRKAGFTGKDGVLVREITVNGPAAKAGLEAGDVITAINGKPFNTLDDLRREIAKTAPDTKLNLSIFRDGKIQDIAATVGTQPDTVRTVASNSQKMRAPTVNTGELGVRVEDIDRATAREYGLTDRKGAVITSVAPDSAAAKSGLKPGDVVTRLNKTEITSAKQFADAIADAKLSDGVRLTVRTEDGMDRLVLIRKQG